MLTEFNAQMWTALDVHGSVFTVSLWLSWDQQYDKRKETGGEEFLHKNCNQTGKKNRNEVNIEKKKADCKASGSIHLWSHAHED